MIACMRYSDVVQVLSGSFLEPKVFTEYSFFYGSNFSVEVTRYKSGSVSLIYDSSSIPASVVGLSLISSMELVQTHDSAQITFFSSSGDTAVWNTTL